jgi:cation:H+ antiporter
MAVMGALTLVLFALGYSRQGKPGRITRPEGGLLVLSFTAYTVWLLYSSLGASAG